MKTKDFLAQDKDTLLKKLTASTDTQMSIRAAEEEMNRILTRSAQENLTPVVAMTAQNMLQTAKAALSFLDTAGEVRVYERRTPESRLLPEAAVRSLVPAGMVWLLGAVLLSRGGIVSVLIGLLLSAGGYAWAFLTGRKTGQDQQESEPPIIQTSTDPQKVYHHMDMLLTVVDQRIQDTIDQENTRIAVSLREEAASGQMEEELKLFSDLLALAYMRRGEVYAREMISDIRFYLHRQQIDVVDYDEKVARLFDMIPSGDSGTIRPALVRDGTVLCKGIAAVQ